MLLFGKSSKLTYTWEGNWGRALWSGISGGKRAAFREHPRSPGQKGKGAQKRAWHDRHQNLLSLYGDRPHIPGEKKKAGHTTEYITRKRRSSPYKNQASGRGGESQGDCWLEFVGGGKKRGKKLAKLWILYQIARTKGNPR